jgi:hypothetical protein
MTFCYPEKTISVPNIGTMQQKYVLEWASEGSEILLLSL